MARTLTSPLHVARHILASDRAWLLFVEIPRRADAGGGVFRLVRNSQHVYGNGYTWQAAAFEIDLPGEDGDGSLGQATLRIPNTSGLPLSYVESGAINGQAMTVHLQHQDHLATFAAALSWKQLILKATATAKVLALQCGHPAGSYRVPSRTFDRRLFPGLLPSGGVQIGGGD